MQWKRLSLKNEMAFTLRPFILCRTQREQDFHFPSILLPFSSWYHISKYRLKSLSLSLSHTQFISSQFDEVNENVLTIEVLNPFVKKKKEVSTLNDVYVLNFFPQESSFERMQMPSSWFPLHPGILYGLKCLKKQWETNWIIDRDWTDELKGNETARIVCNTWSKNVTQEKKILSRLSINLLTSHQESSIHDKKKVRLW